MIHYFIAEVLELKLDPYPLIKVELFNNQIYVKPLELEHIKYPNIKDKVLVLSFDYPINSKLYYIYIDYDRTNSLNLRSLESIHNKVINILNQNPNIIQNNFKSYILYDKNGEILLFCKNGSKIFILDDSIILSEKNSKNYIKISNNSINLLKNKTYFYIKEEKIGLKIDNKKFIQISNDSMYFKFENFVFSIDQSQLYLGNTNNGIQITDGGVQIYTGGNLFDPMTHTHSFFGAGSVGPTTPMSGSVNPPTEQSETTPNDYNI